MTAKLSLLSAALLGVAPLFTIGCSTTVNEHSMTEAIIDASSTDPSSDVSAGHAQCVASMLLKSDLSELTLIGLVKDFANPHVDPADATTVSDVAAEASAQCVSELKEVTPTIGAGPTLFEPSETDADSETKLEPEGDLSEDFSPEELAAAGL